MIASEVSEENKSSRSKKGGSAPKNARKTPQKKAETLKVWCDKEVREYPKSPYAVIKLWVEMTGKSMNKNVAKEVFECF